MESVKDKSTSSTSTVSKLVQNLIVMILAKPRTLNAVTGFATNLTFKLATKVSNRYPQLVEIMHTGMDSLEAKLKEYNAENSSESPEKRSHALKSSSTKGQAIN